MSSSIPDLLFVYGTLRRGFPNPHAEFLAQHSRFVGSGSFPGRLYLLGGSQRGAFIYPGAVHNPAESRRVTGEIFRMHDPEICFQYLDRYEAVGEGFPEPQEYVRQVVPVTVHEDGSTPLCWCYLYNHPVSGLREIEGGDFASAED